MAQQQQQQHAWYSAVKATPPSGDLVNCVCGYENCPVDTKGGSGDEDLFALDTNVEGLIVFHNVNFPIPIYLHLYFTSNSVLSLRFISPWSS